METDKENVAPAETPRITSCCPVERQRVRVVGAVDPRSNLDTPGQGELSLVAADDSVDGHDTLGWAVVNLSGPPLCKKRPVEEAVPTARLKRTGSGARVLAGVTECICGFVCCRWPAQACAVSASYLRRHGDV